MIRPLRHLYVQVLLAIVLGALLGHLAPELGRALKPLGDAFIKLVKMVVAPVIFLTLAGGIAGMRDLSGVGRVAGRALAYFLVVSTLALLIGLVVAACEESAAIKNRTEALIVKASTSTKVAQKIFVQGS